MKNRYHKRRHGSQCLRYIFQNTQYAANFKMDENDFLKYFFINSHSDKKWPNVPRKTNGKLNRKMNFRPSAGIYGPNGRDDSTYTGISSD